MVCLLLWILTTLPVIAQEQLYIIQKGETIYSIARNHGVDPDILLKVNGIGDPKKVQAGQRIKIPQEGAAGPDYLEYQVERGDSLYGIARRYETTIDDIRAVNNLSGSYVLKAGDTLRLPPPDGSGGSRGAAALAEPVKTPASGGAPESSPRPTVSGRVDSSLRWPVRAKEVMYMTGKLYGVALLGERSEPVKSLTQGTVVSAGPYRGFGKVAIIQMAGGYLYVYGGCESLSVKEGDRVAAGTELGKLGVDGVSAKPQLFFLVYRSNAPIDPAKAPRT